MTAASTAALLSDPGLAEPAALPSGARRPRQDRSKASLERMVAAAISVMVERGNEDFTLIEVSKRGNVSIGSIYLRFGNKDNLVRAAIAEAMIAIDRDEAAMLESLSKTCSTLRDFVPQFVSAYAGLLHDHAGMLRLAMRRAEHDPLIAEPGKAAALKAQAQVQSAMLRYDSELCRDDRDSRTGAAFYIIFATLARQLSLGSSEESATDFEWDKLKQELGRMCLAYLTAD